MKHLFTIMLIIIITAPRIHEPKTVVVNPVRSSLRWWFFGAPAEQVKIERAK